MKEWVKVAIAGMLALAVWEYVSREKKQDPEWFGTERGGKFMENCTRVGFSEGQCRFFHYGGGEEGKER